MISAIIPARAGSKSIKHKNLLPLCGKPLLGWTVEQAMDAELIDSVFVATDSHEMGNYASELGAHFFLRGDATATDTAPTESVLEEVVDCVDGIDIVVLLQPTSPIRQPWDIDNAIRRLLETNADSLFSARHIEGYTWTVGGAVTPNYYTRHPRQMQTIRRLEENGSIYVFRTETLKKYRNRLGGKIEFYEMHPLDSFQLDEPKDIEVLENLVAMRLGRNEWSYLST